LVTFLVVASFQGCTHKLPTPGVWVVQETLLGRQSDIQVRTELKEALNIPKVGLEVRTLREEVVHVYSHPTPERPGHLVDPMLHVGGLFRNPISATLGTSMPRSLTIVKICRYAWVYTELVENPSGIPGQEFCVGGPVFDVGHVGNWVAVNDNQRIAVGQYFISGVVSVLEKNAMARNLYRLSSPRSGFPST
jgi:hypothetical protein